MHINPFYIDKYPVTNARVQEVSRCHPLSAQGDINFLRDWKNGTYPEGWANKPVTWVSLEDARAYAQWAGKRLPHEWEWQYAAQGTMAALSWGNRLACRPSCSDAGSRAATMRQRRPMWTRIPTGASPFGVMDMVGNVWQWTDEYTDDHTRAGNPARRKLLPAARIHLVFSAGLSQ